MSRHHPAGANLVRANLVRANLVRAGLVILAALALAGCVVAPGYGRYHPMAYDRFQPHPAAFDHAGYGYGYAQPPVAYVRPMQQQPGFWH